MNSRSVKELGTTNCMIKIVDYKNGNSIPNMQCVIHAGKYKGYGDGIILIVTTKYPNGKIYQLKNNVEKIHFKFMADGKMTIQFIKPPEQLFVSEAISASLKSLFAYIRSILSHSGKHSSVSEYIIDPKRIKKPESFYKKKIKDTTSTTLCGVENTVSNLTLTGNLTKLDDKVLKMSMLRELNLSGNCLKELPSMLGKMQLRLLHLDDNQLENSNFLWLEEPEIRDSLIDFSIANNQLPSFPSALTGFMKLIYLNISNNDISFFPQKLGKLKKLRYLNLSENNNVVLPISLKDITFSKIIIGSETLLSRCGSKLMADNVECKKKNDLQPRSLVALSAVALEKSMDTRTLTRKDLPLDLLHILRHMSLCLCGSVTAPYDYYTNYGPFQLMKAENVTLVHGNPVNTFTHRYLLKELGGYFHECCSYHSVVHTRYMTDLGHKYF